MAAKEYNQLTPQEMEEVIDDFLANEGYDEYLKQAGLWAYVERKERVDTLKNEIEDKIGGNTIVDSFEDLESLVRVGKVSEKYLNIWKEKARVEYVNPVTGEVEGENIVLENARNILTEKNNYNKQLAGFYARAWKNVLDEIKLLPDSGQEDFCQTIKLYDGGDPSLEGINQVIEAYEKTTNIPDYVVLPKEQKQRVEIYKRALRHLKRVKKIREQEFPLCAELMEIVDCLESIKVDKNRAYSPDF